LDLLLHENQIRELDKLFLDKQSFVLAICCAVDFWVFNAFSAQYLMQLLFSIALLIPAKFGIKRTMSLNGTFHGDLPIADVSFQAIFRFI